MNVWLVVAFTISGETRLLGVCDSEVRSEVMKTSYDAEEPATVIVQHVVTNHMYNDVVLNGV